MRRPPPQRGAQRRLRIALGTLAFLALTAGRPCTAGGPPPGATLAATCSGCHGTNGETVGNALPPLAGQSKESLLARLKAFKEGTAAATIMTQLAKGYSDDQLERLAAFFAAQPAPAKAQ